MTEKNGGSHPYQASSIPGYWLNAEDLLRHSLPTLDIGNKQYTTKNAPGITSYFDGQLAEWNTFEDEVLAFWSDERTKRKLQRCVDIPVGPDPEIEKLNPNAMTTERIQCGGEITLSGRFFQNALAPVISCVETMSSPDHGPDDEPDYLPSKLTFGDSWIRGTANDVAGQQPDVIAKLRINDQDKVRLVGELKFSGTVELGEMRTGLVKYGKNKLCAILGQLFNYMHGHELQYAFLSTYEETIFLKLDTKPNNQTRLYFSRVIKEDHAVDESKRTVSVRLALLYLIHKVFSEDELNWRIPEETLKMTESWISRESAPAPTLSTPYGNLTRKVNTGGDASTYEDGQIQSEQVNPFMAPARQQFTSQQEPLGFNLASAPCFEILTPSKPPKWSGKPHDAVNGLHHLASIPDSPLPTGDQTQAWNGPFVDRLRSRGHEEATEDPATHVVASIQGLTVSDPQDVSSPEVRDTDSDENQS